MPVRTSKSKITKTNPEPMPNKQPVYICSKCGEIFSGNARMKNFSKAQSTLYKGNDRYLNWCKDCVNDLYEHYKSRLKDEQMALRRMCMHLDVYWSEEIYESLLDVSSDKPLFRAYLEKANSRKYAGKTYDDTLDEEYLSAQEANIFINEVTGEKISEKDLPKTREEGLTLYGVTSEDIDFWGDQFEPKQYVSLDKKYVSWVNGKGKLTPAQQSLYKQVCITELRIDQEIMNGDSSKVASLQSSLTNLMQKLGITPSQSKENDLAEKNTFAVIAKKLEDRKRIKDATEKNRFIVLYTIYYLGHLCKMLGLNNRYSQAYEDEMARFRIERPELENETDEAVFEAVFAEALKTTEGDIDVSQEAVQKLVSQSGGDNNESD